MKHCTQCGIPLEEGARFCPECGTPSQTDQPPATPEIPVAVAQPAPTPLPEAPAQPAPTLIPNAPGRGSPSKTVAGAGAVVLLLAGAGFYGLKVLTGNGAGGASSPQGAVTGLMEAASARDPLKALSLIAPAQARGADQLYKVLRNKATDAGLVKKGNPFAGLTVSVTNLKTTVQTLGKDAAAVTLTDGDLRYVLRPKDMTPALNAQASDASGHIALSTLGQRTTGVTTPLIAVRQSGKWYVSPADTALELFRRINSLPPGDFDAKPNAKTTGAGSPDGVVKEIAKAVPGVDMSRLLDLISPDELGAVYHYRAAIIEYLTTSGSLSDLQTAGRLSIDDVRTDVVDKTDNTARVILRSASGTVSADGDSGRFTLEDKCLRFVSNTGGSNDNGCLSGELASRGLPKKAADQIKDLSIEVVKVGDRWYFSPVRTLARLSSGIVSQLGRKDILRAVDAEASAPSEGTLSATRTKGTFADSSDYHVYAIEAAAGSYFRICSDASVTTTGPAGADPVYLTDNIYRATTAGTYKVVVNREGDDSFSVSAATITPKPTRLGTQLRGVVNSSTACDADVYTVALSAGQSVLSTGTRAVLLQPNGDYASGPVYKATTTGEHLLVLSNDGAYATQLIAAPADLLARGSFLSSSVTGGPRTLRLYAEAGASLTVAITGSGGFDTVLNILSPSGSVIATNDDYAGSRDPQVAFTPTASGIYVISVSGYNNGIGNFTVNIS